MAHLIPLHFDEAINANQSDKRCSWWRVLLMVLACLIAICAALGLIYWCVFGKVTCDACTTMAPPVCSPNGSSHNKKSPTDPPQRLTNDVPLPYNRHDRMYTALYSGQETHSKMLSTCKRIRNSQLTLEAWHGTAGSTTEEDFDRNIRAYEDQIFESDNKLMWTGCFYEYNKSETNCMIPPLNDVLDANFCDKIGWEKKLRSLQDPEANPEKDRVYIIKDYGESNACWKLFLPKQLIKIMGQPSGSIPRLPFACIFVDNDNVVDE